MTSDRDVETYRENGWIVVSNVVDGFTLARVLYTAPPADSPSHSVA